MFHICVAVCMKIWNFALNGVKFNTSSDTTDFGYDKVSIIS